MANERWRFNATGKQGAVEIEDSGVVDELVVGEWFHLEQMDDRSWWIRVGDARLWIDVGPQEVRVDVERGYYETTCGENRPAEKT